MVIYDVNCLSTYPPQKPVRSQESTLGSSYSSAYFFFQ